MKRDNSKFGGILDIFHNNATTEDFYQCLCLCVFLNKSWLFVGDSVRHLIV